MKGEAGRPSLVASVRLWMGLAFIAVAVGGCTTGASPPTTPQPSRVQLGKPGCNPPSPPGAFSLERQGTARNGQLWAWFMPRSGTWPIQAGQDTKIVWRYTIPRPAGDASISFVATKTDGSLGQLTFGPQGHGSSSWNRPGYEVGTGFVFPTPGCWDIHALSVGMSGDLYFVVV